MGTAAVKRTAAQRAELMPLLLQLHQQEWTQQAIAAELGIAQSTVHYWLALHRDGRTHWGYRAKARRWAQEEGGDGGSVQ